MSKSCKVKTNATDEIRSFHHQHIQLFNQFKKSSKSTADRMAPCGWLH